MSRGRARGRRGRAKRTPKKINKAARAVAAHSHTDAGPDQIVCLLCGETYRAINYWHLKRIHGFEGGHPVQDYKEMFGLRVAACQEVCERHKEVQVERHKKAGRHWTKDRIKREIRKRRGQRHGLAHSKVPVALSIAARRAYGSWDDALRVAGVDPTAHRLTNAWDGARLAKTIRRHAQGGQRVSASWIKEADPELHRAAIRLVGNWTAALRAAGLDPRQHREPKKWSMERVIDWVRDTHVAGGDVRSVAAPAGALGRVWLESDLAWRDFVESLGVPYPGRRPRMNWTDAAVRAEIRSRHRRGLPLHTAALLAEGGGLYQQGAKRFGSWSSALRAAGLDPKAIRRKWSWTREELCSAIRARKRAGKSLAYRHAVADDGRLVQAATAMFPTSWARAIAAAGFDPALARTDAPAREARRRRTK